EDGIRDGHVTGVQTCALPILIIVTANVTAAIAYVLGGVIVDNFSWHGIFYASALVAIIAFFTTWKLLPAGKKNPASGRFDYPGRSEERRVGKGCWGGWAEDRW